MPALLVRQLRRRRADVDSGFCNAPQRGRESDAENQRGQSDGHSEDNGDFRQQKVPAEFRASRRSRSCAESDGYFNLQKPRTQSKDGRAPLGPANTQLVPTSPSTTADTPTTHRSNPIVRAHSGCLCCSLRNATRLARQVEVKQEHTGKGQGRKKCVHGRQPAFCGECGGSQVRPPISPAAE